MVDQNYALALDQCNDMIMGSADIKGILYEISEVFRGIMILKAHPSGGKLLDLPDSEIERLKNVGANIKMAQLDTLSRTFSSVNRELEYSINERWILESTIIRCMSVLKKDS